MATNMTDIEYAALEFSRPYHGRGPKASGIEAKNLSEAPPQPFKWQEIVSWRGACAVNARLRSAVVSVD
jgi:hypothetical protein